MSAPSSGGDPSPAAIRAMAVVRWMLLVAVGATALTTWWTLVLRGDAPSIGEARFYCPMHPEITSQDPGTCPVCFMTLEPIPDDLGAASRLDAHEHEPIEPEPGSVPAGTAPVMLTTERIQASGIAWRWFCAVSRRGRSAGLPWSRPSMARARRSACGPRRSSSASGARVWRDGTPWAGARLGGRAGDPPRRARAARSPSVARC
jgi:hypothetical protein